MKKESYSHIIDGLVGLSEEKEVCILMAVEAGSRAWGFESPDSDYDIRFIYMHPLKWYLTPFPKRDVIERMDGDYDYAGWDLRKALALLKKSNPTFLEWIYSPTQYVTAMPFFEELRQLADLYYSRKAAFHHYMSLALNNRRNYLDKGSLTVKKHLYVVRGIMCAKWVLNRTVPPPVNFDQLYKVTGLWSDEVISAVDDLLVMKRKSVEAMESVNVPILKEFINDSLDKGHGVDVPADAKPDNTAIDEFFYRYVTASDNPVGAV